MLLGDQPEPATFGDTGQVNAASVSLHSASSRGFRARKLIPSVPNWAALDACGASAKTSTRAVTSNPTKPAATTVA